MNHLQIISSKLTVEKQETGLYKGVWRGYTVEIKRLCLDVPKEPDKGWWIRQTVTTKTLQMRELEIRLVSEFVSQRKDAFTHQAKIIANLQSRYIACLYGVVIKPTCLVMEHMPKGDLQSLLRKTTKPLPWEPYRWKIAVGIIKGLRHLHNQGIVHGNLHSRNILITHKCRPKITDIGFPTSLGIYVLPWMAPEVFEKKATKKADIYSFAIILLEIATRKKPWGYGFYNARIMVYASLGHRPTIPSNCPKALASLITRCWSHDPNRRPTANGALDRLNRVQYLRHLRRKKIIKRLYRLFLWI